MKQPRVMESQIEIMENIRLLRTKLKILNQENKSLKQRLDVKQETIKNHATTLKSACEDKRFVQKLLHGYAGAEVTISDDLLEIYFKPFCSGVPQGKYIMVLQAVEERSWQVVGYNLPLSISGRQGTTVQSTKQLGVFIREVANEVQAYAERKYQVTRTEEIFKEVNASIWYTTKLQTIFLKLPMTLADPEENAVCEIELHYEGSEILPFRVTSSAQGIDAAKMNKLRNRLENLFKNFSLFTVMKEEFGNNSTEESGLSSILGHLSSS